MNQTTQQKPCRYCGGIHQLRQCPAYGNTFAECGKVEHFKKVCHSKRSRVANKMEQEMSQEYKKGKIKMVSINSVYMNKNWLMLTAKLDTHACSNKIMIPYKIDKGIYSNIMPWYIFKKLFPSSTKAELTKTVKTT